MDPAIYKDEISIATGIAVDDYGTNSKFKNQLQLGIGNTNTEVTDKNKFIMDNKYKKLINDEKNKSESLISRSKTTMENYENTNKLKLPLQLSGGLENKIITEDIKIHNLEDIITNSGQTTHRSKTPAKNYTRENQLNSLYESFVNKNSIQINNFNENK